MGNAEAEVCRAAGPRGRLLGGPGGRGWERFALIGLAFREAPTDASLISKPRKMNSIVFR